MSTGIGDLTDPDRPDILVQDDEDKANVINEYLSSMFTRETLVAQALMPLKNVKCLDEITISVAEVQKQLRSLLKSKSLGPDQFHSIVLIDTADNLSETLTIILRKSL